MSDDPTLFAPEEEADLLAAEYVLGSLEPTEARLVEARARAEPNLASGIAAWEMRLLPLADLVEPVPPPPVLWQRLALATGIDSVIRPLPARRRSGWPTAAAVSMALAASMAFLLLTRPPAPQPDAAAAAPLVAALSPYGAPGATFLVRVGADGRATVLAMGDTNVPAGKSLELWAVAGKAAPVSMGLLPASGRATLTIPVAAGTQLLVSQEPQGGSTTKAPTGPVVYAGLLAGI